MSKKLLNPLTKKLFLVILFSLFTSLTAFAEDTWCGHIDGFKFKNSNSSVMISNNGTYSLNELPNNFYVQLIVDGYSQSAKFYLENLSTGNTYNLTENYEPYTFPGGGSAWNYGTGVFKLKAKLYKYNYCGGWTCDTETVQFTLTNASSCGEVDGFTFTNGNTSTDIIDGNTYEVNNLPTDFFVESQVSGNSESVKLILKNLDTNQTYYVGENYEPYTIPGGGSVWNYGYGNFKLTAKVYIYDYCQSTVCDEETIYFTLNNTPSCGTLANLYFTDGTATVTVNEGQSYDIQDLPENFYIDAVINGSVSKVKYYVTNLDTNTTTNITESITPYTFPATGSSWNLGAGNFQITAKLYTTTISYSGNNCGSNSQTDTFCDEYTYTFTLTDSSVCGTIDAFAFTDGAISTSIVDGQSYFVTDLPTDFYINTLTSGAVENVELEVTNLDTGEIFIITETTSPYTYPAGQSPWNLGLGNFQITAKLYAQSPDDSSNNNDSCDDNNSGWSGWWKTSSISTQQIKSEGTLTNSTSNKTGGSSCGDSNHNHNNDCGGNDDDDNSLTLCEEQTIQFTLLEQPCNVVAGTGIPNLDAIVIPQGSTFDIVITPNGDAVVEAGYNLGTVLASVNGEVIYSVSQDLTLTLPYLSGPYRVHMFVYDPLTFDFSSINIGVDTITDVQNAIANSNVCADLADTGAQIVIIPGGIDQRSAQTNNTKDSSTKGETETETNEALQQLVTAKVEEEEALTNTIKLYPNPVVDYLTVDLVFNEGEIFEFTLTDLNGKQVMAGNISNRANTINVNSVVNGLYIIKLKSGFRTITKKIVVRK
ncbi:MAG TPA: T9SS type A sorting domain-containing protein [Flavobacteriaceae bacterium]|nr:T9SS type A sorting domain-containing protein [Flavobacteriaceae bacterium]